MLETILAISGKPGLYRLVSRGSRRLIVETLDDAKKRMPTFPTEKVISLADIAIYTDEGELPLREVFDRLKKKEEGRASGFDYKKASRQELTSFFAEIVPDYDRERVHSADIRKMVGWYNLLVKAGMTDFDEALAPTEGDHISDRAATGKSES